MCLYACSRRRSDVATSNIHMKPAVTSSPTAATSGSQFGVSPCSITPTISPSLVMTAETDHRLVTEQHPVVTSVHQRRHGVRERDAPPPSRPVSLLDRADHLALLWHRDLDVLR